MDDFDSRLKPGGNAQDVKANRANRATPCAGGAWLLTTGQPRTRSRIRRH
ncbi:hypothetical protein RS9916_40356 [Synechococcus sp. RS9916]|nr:hypothetical protein RS9916_40356 [Synechococcus sp. RS9916]